MFTTAACMQTYQTRLKTLLYVYQGMTAVMYAFDANDLDSAKALLAHGADASQNKMVSTDAIP